MTALIRVFRCAASYGERLKIRYVQLFRQVPADSVQPNSFREGEAHA
jgi:hypothetical protein